MFSISIVIPAHNEEKLIGKCLESIVRHRPANLLEIIVVDNASTDRTKEIAGSYAGVRVVTEPRKGLSFARQRGLLEAKGDLFASLDADTIVPAQWWSVLHEEFAKDPHLLCLTGPYYFYDQPQWQSVAMWEMSRVLTWINGAVRSPFICGGNFAAWKKSIVSAGGFDTSIAFYGEDINLAARLRKIGKIKISFRFAVQSSARRFVGQGLMKTVALYGVNQASQSFVGKSVTRAYRDIR